MRALKCQLDSFSIQQVIRHMAPATLFLILGASVVTLIINLEKYRNTAATNPNLNGLQTRLQLMLSKKPGPEQNGGRRIVSAAIHVRTDIHMQ